MAITENGLGGLSIVGESTVAPKLKKPVEKQLLTVAPLSGTPVDNRRTRFSEPSGIGEKPSRRQEHHGDDGRRYDGPGVVFFGPPIHKMPVGR